MEKINVLYDTIKDIANGVIQDYKAAKIIYGKVLSKGEKNGYKIQIENTVYDNISATGKVTIGFVVPIILIDSSMSKMLILSPTQTIETDNSTLILDRRTNIIKGNYEAGTGINITGNVISTSPSYDFVSASDSLDDITKPGVYFVSATEENNRGINGASEPFMMLVNNKDDEVNQYAHIGANIYHRKILGEWEVKS